MLVGTREHCCAGKLTGLDKQLSKSLDVEVQNDTSAAELATSPVGPLSEPSRYDSCEKSRYSMQYPNMVHAHAISLCLCAAVRLSSTSSLLSISASPTTTFHSFELAISKRRKTQQVWSPSSTVTFCRSPRYGTCCQQILSDLCCAYPTVKHRPFALKVWELNPRYGTGKFLDALWASIDEVCTSSPSVSVLVVIYAGTSQQLGCAGMRFGRL